MTHNTVIDTDLFTWLVNRLKTKHVYLEKYCNAFHLFEVS